MVFSDRSRPGASRDSYGAYPTWTAVLSSSHDQLSRFSAASGANNSWRELLAEKTNGFCERPLALDIRHLWPKKFIVELVPFRLVVRDMTCTRQYRVGRFGLFCAKRARRNKKRTGSSAVIYGFRLKNCFLNCVKPIWSVKVPMEQRGAGREALTQIELSLLVLCSRCLFRFLL